PKIANEGEDDVSVYLKEWMDLGVKQVDKTRESYAASGDGIGNYKDLLSTVIAIHHGEVDKELTKEEQTFWSVAVRYLRKKMAQDG
ncbi:hypothetical protein ACXWO6_09520, partial [Streptococcus pyogenes]